MNNTQKLLALIAAILLIIVAAVVIVGLVNGTWPWDGKGWFTGEYHGLPSKPTTSADAQNSTTGDPTDTTGDPTGTTQDPTETTSGSTGGNQSPVQREEGDIVISLDGNSKPTTGGTTGTTDTTGDTQNTETTGDRGGDSETEDGDVFIPIDGNDGTIDFNDLVEADG